MMSLQALRIRDECWYRDCMLPGAPVVGRHPDGSAAPIRLCGLHLEVILLAMPRRDVEVALWLDREGAPVLVLHRIAA
jgi:hypothetical protein